MTIFRAADGDAIGWAGGGWDSVVAGFTAGPVRSGVQFDGRTDYSGYVQLLAMARLVLRELAERKFFPS